MSKEERDLLLILARIVLAKHNSSGPGADGERAELRRAIAAANQSWGKNEPL